MVWHLKSLATAEKDGKLSMLDAIDFSVSKGRGTDRTARCYSISVSHSVRSFWASLPTTPTQHQGACFTGRRLCRSKGRPGGSAATPGVVMPKAVGNGHVGHARSEDLRFSLDWTKGFINGLALEEPRHGRKRWQAEHVGCYIYIYILGVAPSE